MPSNNMENPPVLANDDPADRAEESLNSLVQPFGIHLDRHSIDPGRCRSPYPLKSTFQCLNVYMVQQCREPRLA